MKIGRNDPCPCGSGKKYKKCCQAKQTEIEFFWSRVHKERERLIEKMMLFCGEYCASDVVEDAWPDFKSPDRTDEAGDFDPIHMNLFWSWFYFQLPYPKYTEETEKNYPELIENPVGETFLTLKSDTLTELQIEYVKKCLQAPFSFYDVIEVRQGHGMAVKDIFTFEEFEVVEKSASNTLKKGDIVFGMLLTMKNLTVFESLGVVAIPPLRKVTFIDIRKNLKKITKTITRPFLMEYQEEMICFYLEIFDEITNPQKIKLHNMDGEELVCYKLIYKISGPHETFEKIHKLNVLHSREELLEHATLDKNSKVKKIIFDWSKKGNKRHKSWTNTILGKISIQQNKMTVEVNSRERSEEIKSILKKLLGESATLQNAVIQDFDAAMKEANKRPPVSLEEQKKLMNDPKAQEHMREFLKSHWDEWMTTKIMALNNQAPEQAARSKEGRELLEALITDYERRDSQTGRMDNLPFLKNIREKLGLSQEDS